MSEAVEHHERDLLDQAIAERGVIAVPSMSSHAVLNVAGQLDAPVVPMENLARFRTPYPWLAEKGRFIQIACVDRRWLFP
ncbi:hypothetical protein OG301_32805 [Streptomyces platensis]|uniref:hypothetical protein n=1 Tax=Streptomyces platensis TaxID=58346 RepID=UPI002ED2C9E4|nr:hypothetical protein OG301_32805 [Streptomyces platensis]